MTGVHIYSDILGNIKKDTNLYMKFVIHTDIELSLKNILFLQSFFFTEMSCIFNCNL